MATTIYNQDNITSSELLLKLAIPRWDEIIEPMPENSDVAFDNFTPITNFPQKIIESLLYKIYNFDVHIVETKPLYFHDDDFYCEEKFNKTELTNEQRNILGSINNPGSYHIVSSSPGKTDMIMMDNHHQYWKLSVDKSGSHIYFLEKMFGTTPKVSKMIIVEAICNYHTYWKNRSVLGISLKEKYYDQVHEMKPGEFRLVKSMVGFANVLFVCDPNNKLWEVQTNWDMSQVKCVTEIHPHFLPSPRTLNIGNYFSDLKI